MKTLLLEMFQSLKKVPSTLISSPLRFTKLPVSIFAIIFLFLTGNAVGQCTNCQSNFPSGTFSTTSSSWTNVATNVYGGEYAYYNVSLGSTYQWQTCGGASYDTQLTLREGSNCSGTFIAYNDDFCSLQSQITWTATFTGTVTVLLSEYNCANNSTSTTVQWRCSNYVPPCTAPTAFTLTGGGTCLSGPSAVGLSGSQTGVNYQLKKNGINEGAVVAGTGAAISFGNQTAGTYTVEASGSGYCTVTFPSSVSVSLNPLSISGTSSLCAGASTTLTVNGLSNSSGTNYTTTYNSSNGTMQTVFTGNGTFVNGSGTAITAKTLLVGGGGGGAARHGGGGGGGGVLYNASMSIPVGNLPVVIGAGGGAGDYQNSVNHGNGIGAGGNGGNTTFNGSTAFGGGGGKTYENNTHATPGGSGGGGGGNTGTVNNGVAGGTQGNAGGAGPNTTNGNAGGGGGAGVAGGIASGNNGGNGGNGSNQSANFGTSVGQNGWFGGGGGGGSRGNSTTCGSTGGTAGTGGVGGNGGGGRGGDLGNHTNGTAGLANTGGGGGGNRSCNTTTNFAGFAGGSGVVILNYPAGIWSSSNTAVATVSQSGLVSVLPGATAGQSAVITYTSVSGCSVTTTVLVSSNSAPIAIETANNLCSGTVTLSTTTPKPIAHYTFDGTLNDISGNGLHLTPISGTATYTENGLVLSGGGTMRFDSPSNSLLSGAVDYTIEFDFKQTAADGSYGKIFTWAPSGDRAPGIFHLPGGSNTGFHWRHDSDLNPCCGGNAGVNYQAGIALNQWYHVVGVRKGTRFELYVNGILVDYANDLPTDGRAGSAPFVFGAFPGNSAPAGTIIKNFKIFNNALEWYTGSCGGTFVSSEPSPIVNPASTSTYYVRNRNVCGTSSCTPIIVNRGPIPAVPTVSAGTPSICGSGTTTLVAGGMAPGGQVATLGNNASDVIGGSALSGHLNNHTMEFWVNPNRTIVLHSEINSGVSGNVGLPATEYSFAIAPNQIGGVGCVVTNAGVGVSVGTNGVEVVQHGPCHFPVTLSFATAISGWTHIAVVHVSNVPHLFINGRLVRVGLESLYPTFPNTGTSFPYGYFGGSIDNVRIWNVARTQQQLIDNMNLENATGTGLVAHYPFNGNANALVGSNGTISGGTSFTNATYYTYTWSGGPALPAASTNQTQTTGTISTNGTHNYTVTATAGGCSGTASANVAVTVNPNLPASVTVAASPAGTICAGTSVTFTATPTNGGTTPSYQWKVNGANVGTNSPTFTSAALTNGQAVTCEMTSNATPCLTGSPATSNTVTMTVTPSVAASVSIAATPGTNVCIGTNVTFTATPTNGGTPSYQWKLNGSNVGTNSPTYSNNALINTSAVTCVMTSTATCATGSPATSNSISGIVPSAPTAVSGTASAVCQVPAGSGWVRFLDGSGRLVVSINPGSNNLGLVTADAYDHGSSVLTQACNTGTNPEWTTAVLGRSWRITPTNNLGASLELPFEDGEMSNLVTASSNTASNPRDNVTSRGDLKMSRYSGASQNGSWSDNCADGGTSLIGSQLGNGTSPAGIAASQYVQFATPGFSEFWLHGNTTASPLPITLTNFGASCNEKGDVALNWSTASEQNASHFVIERSRDLVTWNVVSTLPAGGNTTTEQLYALTDVDALGGVSYYRLVQVDFDGESEVYGPISVTCESATSNTMTVFPNPTKADFTVEITSTSSATNATLQLTDLTGKVIASRQVDLVAGNNQLLFSDLDLQMGTYIIRIQSELEIRPVKLVVN